MHRLCHGKQLCVDSVNFEMLFEKKGKKRTRKDMIYTNSITDTNMTNLIHQLMMLEHKLFEKK